MAVLRLFASVRVAAGTGKVDVPGDTVGDVLAAADEKFGQGFAGMATTCRVWLNGESARATDVVGGSPDPAGLGGLSRASTGRPLATHLAAGPARIR